MARTALMQLLRRLASEHQEASTRGVAVAQVRAERRSEISRRDVLRGAGVAAAALGAAELARAPLARAAGAPRIAIVGGGIAGLNAALTLDDAGYASTVYEASADVGGRMRSDTTSFPGQVTEWCGELIDTGHNTVQQLCQRFRLQLDDLRAAQPNGTEDTYYALRGYYLEEDLDRDFQPVHNVLRDQTNATSYPTLYNLYTAAGWDLDHTSLYDWIERYVPGGHRSKLGIVLDLAYNIEYGRETREQSSLNLVYLLGYNASPGAFRMFGKSDERYHIRGGNQQLPRAIAAALPADAVKTGYRLARIARNTDGSYALSFSTSGGTRNVTADRVILALPFSVLRTLDFAGAGFDARKVTAIQQLGYGTNAKLHAQFDARVWNQDGPWGRSSGGSYSDTGYQCTWEVTRAQPGAQGILVDYTGGATGAAYAPSEPYSTQRAARTRTYAQQFLNQIEPVFPGLSARFNGNATLSVPALDPNLRGSYSCWLVGQYTAFAGYERARQGNVHFAGEHCSIDFQGFMEGGASEGARAASEILSDFRAGISP